MDGFLTRAIAVVRDATDEPELQPKYTDTKIAAYLQKSYAHVLSEANRCSRTPVTAQCDITIVGADEDQAYALPPVVKAIREMHMMDDTGNRLEPVRSRGTSHVWGPKYTLEGTTLKIRAGSFAEGDILRITFTPSGAAALHEGVCTIDATGTIVTLAETPTKGTRDTRINAYAGSTLRVLGATTTGNYVQDRLITAYDVTTLAATVSPAVNPIPTGIITYEIAPPFDDILDEAIALDTALRILGIEGNIARQQAISLTYQTALRDLRLTMAQRNATAGHLAETRIPRRW